MIRVRKRAWFLILLSALVLVGAGAVTNRLLAGDQEEGTKPSILEIFNLFGNGKERTNILVFGVDASTPEKADKRRSDSIMLVSVDAAGKDPVIVSIPRDTRAVIPGRKNPDKVNHAHAFGGPELLVESVENLLDLEIDYYVRINYQAVIEVVDALGGVEVDVQLDMKYNDPYDDPPLRINIPKGLQVLDGQNAVHFLRYRKGYADQDLGRIQAQQQFVQALKEKVLSPSVIPKIPQLIEIFYTNVQTDIPKSKLLSLGAKMAGIEVSDLTKLTLPGGSKYIDGISYYLADEEEVFQMKNAYLVSDAQKIFRVKVLNGCGVSGLASKYETILTDKDILVSKVGNFDGETVEVSYLEYLPGFKKQAEKVGKLLGIDQLNEVEGLKEGEIHAIIGADLNQP